MEVTQKDVLSAGRDQIVLEAGPLRVAVAPERGGRMVEISHEGVNALHCVYPKGVTFGPYTEYGGLEEHVGSAPGTVWNAPWEVQQADGSVAFTAFSNRTLVRKQLALDGEASLLRIRYEFSNYSNHLARFTFGIHPELSLGGDHRAVRYHVPEGGTVRSGRYSQAGFREYLIPDENWCAATAGDRLFLQMLPPRVMDCLEIYYPKVDTHLVLEPVVWGVGLCPDKCASFDYLIYYGPGDAGRAAAIYAEHGPHLATEYGPAGPRPDMPEPAERRDQGGFDLGAGVERAMRGGRGPMPRIHVEHIHVDVQPEIERGLREAERAAREMRRDAERGIRDAQRAARRALEQFRNAPPAPPRPPAPPVPPRPPAPARDVRPERMAILQGLAEGHFDAEEAARRLEALGRGL